MSVTVDRSYRKVPFNDTDKETANIKFPPHLFHKKQTWAFILIPLGLFIFYGVVIIILNHFWWKHEGQFNRLLNILIYIPILFFIMIIVKIINMIDHKLGYKRIGLFKVTYIAGLGKAKLLVLNGWRVFRIDIHSPIFKTVQKHQILKIEKTATGQLLYPITIKRTGN